MNKIIYQPWGGLGDNLQYSTFPEQCYKQGIKCFLHKNNTYRNNEIYDLISMNPYISGISDDNNTIELLKNFNADEFIHQHEKLNDIMLSETPYPKIYYKSDIIKEFENKTVVNLESISNIYNSNELNNIISNIDDDFINLKFSTIVENKSFNIKTTSDYLVKSLFEHCDIINSCKKYICLFSGASVLASAIKYDYGKQDILVYTKSNLKNMVLNNNFYNFKNNRYVFI